MIDVYIVVATWCIGGLVGHFLARLQPPPPFYVVLMAGLAVGCVGAVFTVLA